MSKARLVITAVVVEGRRPAEVAATYGVARSWVYELVARYRTEGPAAFEPRSRRPLHSPRATPAEVAERVVELRDRLVAEGHDAGADTIRWHLQHHHQLVVSRPTVHRILQRNGRVIAAPNKRPRSSYIRFQADQPNECWQSDFTHYRLAGGADVEIITWLDDHSRYALDVSAHERTTGPIVVATFRRSVATYGAPASTLTDNGLVYTTRFSGGKGGRNTFEHELRQLHITQKNSRPNHPTTCGKVERFQQTLKNWLARQPDQPATITALQTLLDRFVDDYNNRRPHSSLPHRATPTVAYTARPKATPQRDRTNDDHYRVRHDRIDTAGRITLRHNGRLHHIGIGRTHTGTRVLVLVDDLDIRVINAATGEILRALTLDPTRDYQPTGKPIGGPSRPYGPRKRKNPNP